MSVSPAQLIEIPPRSGTAFRLHRDELLTIVDPCGEQVADVVAFAQPDVREALSSGRTLDYAGTLALTTGAVLYSNRSRPMFTIVHDDVGRHDFLLTPCSVDTFRIIYGRDDGVPGCFGNLAAALQPFGIEPDAIPTTFNAFMNVEIAPDGWLTVKPPRSKPGDRLELRAEMDLIVGLTACSADQSNNYSFKPIRYAVTASPLPR